MWQVELCQDRDTGSWKEPSLRRSTGEEEVCGGRSMENFLPDEQAHSQEMLQDPLDAKGPGCQHLADVPGLSVKGTVFAHSLCPCSVDF